jgi:quercetin dioxygenase-like cupin family protein
VRRVVLLLTVVVVAASSAGRAQAPAAPAAPAHAGMLPAEIKWGPAPPALPPGAQAAVLAGDPSKEGVFVLRAKLPAGYRVPPHWHPVDEYMTVISGTLQFGMGDKFDAASMRALTAGSYVTAEKDMRHFVQAKGPTVIQVTAMGPFQITYVNQADDPRTKAQ